MSIKQVIGITILTTLFVLLYVFIAIVISYIFASQVFCISSGITILIVFALFLIFS